MSHDHHNHSHPPRHPFQADHPEPGSYYELLGVALNELLQEHGIYSADELRAKIEGIESVGADTHGAAIVARAWTDPEFRSALKKDATEAIRAIGIDPGYTDIIALENTDALHNVVVCTLCSCYPRWLLGRPPAWYKSKAYRARVVREPRGVLAEFGVDLAADVEVRVHDSTAELRYLVLPVRPEGTRGWSPEQLMALISRDSMIGVAKADEPETTAA